MKTPQTSSRRTLGLWPSHDKLRKSAIPAAAAALALGFLSTASAEVVAGLDNFDDGINPTVPVLATGVTASVTTTGEGRNWIAADARGSSSDGTWGTSVGPPSADTTASTDQSVPNLNLELSNGATGGTITLTITNGSVADIDLEAFHMDALAFRPKAARTYTLDVMPGGAITDGNVYTSGSQEIKSQGSVPPDNDQGNDIDHDLTFLDDSTLEVGGTVEFLLTFSGGDGSSPGHDLWIDNLAVTSSSVDANRLAFTMTPASATAGEDFSVTIEAQDGSGTPLVDGVSQDTEIVINVPDGTGVLSGTTATILMGDNSVILPTLQYTKAEDINLIASQFSGDLLAPSAESSTITINAGPASVLSVEFSNDPEVNDPVGNTYFRINDPADILDVFAVSRDSVGNFIAYETTAVFTLENITGAVMASDLIDNMDGSASFTAQALGTANIRASVSGLPDGESGLMIVEEPQFRWTGNNGGFGAAANWLDGVLPPFDNTTDLFFYDEYTGPTQLFINGNRTARSLNFTEFADPQIAGGLGIRYLQNNSLGNATDLTLDTDSLVDPVEINVAMGAEANINMGNVNNFLFPDNSANYGDLILADPLLITHLGTGSLIFSRPIAETGGSMGVTIDASSTGLVNYLGANTYTGPTTVSGGTLVLNGESIDDRGTLVADGGMIQVAADERMAGLTIGGEPQPDGEYGSTESGVENPDDDNFTGPGRITVGPPPPSEEIVITSIAKTGDEEITIDFTSPGLVDVYGSTVSDGFVWSLFEEDIPSGTWVDTFASPAQTFYILVTADEDPPADNP